MKKILITGQNSYIGTSVKKWLEQSTEKYEIAEIDVKGDAWKAHDFSKYDVVFHVAGIAHVSSDPELEELYYKVNRDLTIEVASKTKTDGVKQFIFMSSMIVYGDSGKKSKTITSKTKENPSNFYGESKLQAEQGIMNLANDEFRIVIMRPPMIYGVNSKGNYPRLAKMAKRIPLFPNIDNERSMLHIDNLCEMIRLIIDSEDEGIFYPQNREYVNTSELVKTIAEVSGKKIHLTKIFNPIIRLMFGLNVVKKVFGNLTYDKEMSRYVNGNYQIRSFRESVELTERNEKR